MWAVHLQRKWSKTRLFSDAHCRHVWSFSSLQRVYVPLYTTAVYPESFSTSWLWNREPWGKRLCWQDGGGEGGKELPNSFLRLTKRFFFSEHAGQAFPSHAVPDWAVFQVLRWKRRCPSAVSAPFPETLSFLRNYSALQPLLSSIQWPYHIMMSSEIDMPTFRVLFCCQDTAGRQIP